MTEARQELPSERRENLRLRAIFDEARPMIAQLLAARASWGGAPLELSAFRMFREEFPDLSALEVHALVRAALRVRAEAGTRPSAPLPKQTTVHHD
ncbi:MAG: hypothetical protein IT495_17610 [Gammaproteobacteria bacterium]|nr:hypothetical protein [Gammaproteobacteria bacterium]